MIIKLGKFTLTVTKRDAAVALLSIVVWNIFGLMAQDVRLSQQAGSQSLTEFQRAMAKSDLEMRLLNERIKEREERKKRGEQY